MDDERHRLELDQQLTLRVTPALVTYAGLLVLPGSELDHRVAREVADNPALLAPDTSRCLRCGGISTGRHCASCRSSTTSSERSGVTATEHAGRPARQSPEEELLAEVAPLLGRDERRVAAYLLAELDGRGVLGREPGEVAADLGVTDADVRRVIGAIRSVGPPGICAASVVELLLLQIDALEDRRPVPAPVRSVVADHLDALAAGRVAVIAEALGTTVAAIDEAAAFVRRHLRPSAAPGTAVAPDPGLAPPDILLHLEPGDPPDVVVEIVDRYRLRLDPLHARLAADDGRRLTGDERAAVAARVEQAKTFLAALDRRSRTLAVVAGHAARHQLGFLRHGPAAHRPLTRSSVARDLGLHESTVSRAVCGKWVRLPSGEVVPLTQLFGARTAVLVDLRELANGPGAGSDAELARQLAVRGHLVARRTVAKYRALLGIPPARS